MQAAALTTAQYPRRRWRDGPQGQSRARRNVPLADVGSGEVIVQRVLSTAHLEPVTRERLACILMTTVRDWARGEAAGQ